MKQPLMLLALLSTLVPLSEVEAVERPSEVQEELFSTQGTISQMSLEEKFFRLRNEAGLEFTFRIDEGTQVKSGTDSKTLSDLAVNDSVTVDYLYNENYDKIARTLRKEARKLP